MFAPVHDHQSYFPILEKTLAERKATETGRRVVALETTDVGIFSMYRKVNAKPFNGVLEWSTSVGDVPESVTSSYASGGRRLATSSIAVGA